MCKRALLLAAVLGVCVAAAPADVLLPESPVAAPIEGTSYTRVTVFADGTIEHAGGAAVRAYDDVVIPALSSSLRAWHATDPDGAVLLAGDRRADFRAVREVLTSTNDAGIAKVGFLAGPETSPPRVIPVAQKAGDFDPIASAPTGPTLPPLTVHLKADGISIGRKIETLVHAPYVGGELDLVLLTHLFDEDKRLHPSARLVIINTDDGVPYAETFAALALSREKAYPYTLLAGGPASATPRAPSPPPPLDARLEHFPRVTLGPAGGADFRASDGTVEIVRADRVTGYEAHCDARACDLVLRTETRRLALGERPNEAPFAPALFGRPLHRYAGRLGVAPVEREGALSPFVLLPGTDPYGDSLHGDAAAPPIILGVLDKKLIDDVIREPTNMGRVRDCYNALLGRDRNANGKITVKFVITKDGTVSSAAIKSSTLGDEVMHACVTDTFRTFEFPEPKGGGIVIVSYPFIFTPG